DVRLAISREGAQVSAVLALGSNLGDREGYLARALERLTAEPGIDVSWTGPVVETQPVGGPDDQGPFLNTVIGVHTSLGPFDVRLAISREGAQVSAVLALGSNLGDREGYLARALERLTAEPGIDVSWTGPVVETQPVGGPDDQGPFLNTVIGVHTSLGPFDLLAVAQRLERDAHRERLVRWGPRTL